MQGLHSRARRYELTVPWLHKHCPCPLDLDRRQVEPLFAAFWVRKATGTGVKAQPQHCLSPDAELQAQVQQEQQQVQYEQVQEQQAQAQQQPQEQQALEAQPPAQDLFIDTAVYTRNR